MEEYTYVAIDKYGKEKKGNIQGENMDAVTAKLKSNDLIVVEIKKASVLTKDINISFGSPVKPRDLSVFCRQFVSMVSAGVTILDALTMLSTQTENKAMAKAVEGIELEIEKGETMAHAMELYPKIFPPIMISMVAAGEASGKLDVAFERMSEHFEKSAKLKGMIRKASVYPIMVCVVAIVVVIVMLVKIIPGYTEMFNQMDAELPAITRVVVAMSDFLMKYWYMLALVVVAIVVGINIFKKTETGQIFFGSISRKVPIFGKLTVKTAASQFARTLSTLIYAGLPMIEALVITSNTMGNYLFKRALLEAKEDVAKGIPLSEPLERCGLFPPMVTHMTRIGEETGDLENMLNRLADYYDEEVEMATQTVMAALEPLIILVLAAIVGLLIAAVMSPMISMYGAMDSL